MRCTTGLHRHLGRRQALEERQHLLAFQLFAQDRLLRLVHPMKLKKMLRRVHANTGYLVHGRLPADEFSTASSWHTDAVRGPSTPTGPPHNGAVRLDRHAAKRRLAMTTLTATLKAL
jgi:hypothetical protein